MTVPPVIEEPVASLRSAGRGTPVLLLHGWRASAELWGSVFTNLAAEFAVYAPDFPGFGGTDSPIQAWGTHDYVKWTIALLDRLKLKQVHIVGHSFGGRVGIELAAKWQGRVASLILVDASGVPPRRGVDFRLKVVTYKLGKRISQSSLIPESVRKRIMHHAQKLGSSDYQASSGALRQSFVKIVNEDSRPFLPKITVPTLIIWGSADQETPLSDAKLMEAVIPDAGLVVFEGAGHFSYAEAPDRFCKIVRAFLQNAK